jgi:anhydro-N-acetylmuramic acid kinase
VSPDKSKSPARVATSNAAGAVKAKAMIVAGVMSGTSADGVDVALCRVSPGRDGAARVKVLGHRAFAYERKLRATVLRAASGEATSAADFARLSWRLGEVYADGVEATARGLKLTPQLVACHGQTIVHQAVAQKFLGSPLRCTWQIGEAAAIAERLRIPVVSDFRPADMAAGGQGAPLVPMLDFCMFRHATKSRLLLNLGGIANVTALPAACSADEVMAFDTGPANMVIDAAMRRLYDRGFDKNGEVAARGRVLTGVVKRLTETAFFSAPPPKSCGREEFGAAFVATLLTMCEHEGAHKHDVIATATALTAQSVLEAYRRFCWPHLGQHAPLARATEIFVAGGGAKNATLMRMLSDGFAQLGIIVKTTAAAGLAVEAKEAAAFALLGWLTWHGLPGNVPSATGAARAVVLGKVSLA